jgi:excinuclease ABC subunit C
LALIIHTYINGKLLTVNKLINEYYDNLDELIVSCLNDYYLHNFNLPQQVYLPLEQKYLSDLNYQNKIKFINPKAGKFISIIKLANTNAEQYFKSDYLVYKRQKALNEDAFEQLKQLLGIDNLNLINVFDMSNLFGTEKVGGMIALSNGEFNKKLYRKFIIKDANNVGDTQAMNEVVSRQYKRTLSERQSLPNLIIVDGGINQVNATIKALQTIKLDQIIPVIGLYKDRNHKTDGIIYREQKIALDHKSGLYLYLFNIQEEVHRFAISFFRQRKHRLN